MTKELFGIAKEVRLQFNSICDCLNVRVGFEYTDASVFVFSLTDKDWRTEMRVPIQHLVSHIEDGDYIRNYVKQIVFMLMGALEIPVPKELTNAK
jgi:hypothetical protein